MLTACLIGYDKSVLWIEDSLVPDLIKRASEIASKRCTSSECPDRFPIPTHPVVWTIVDRDPASDSNPRHLFIDVCCLAKMKDVEEPFRAIGVGFGPPRQLPVLIVGDLGDRHWDQAELDRRFREASEVGSRPCPNCGGIAVVTVEYGSSGGDSRHAIIRVVSEKCNAHYERVMMSLTDGDGPVPLCDGWAR